MPFFFFFNDTATTEIYTLSLHDALPISSTDMGRRVLAGVIILSLLASACASRNVPPIGAGRSEEHTSELQSLAYLVCRLLLEKKNTNGWIRQSYLSKRD